MSRIVYQSKGMSELIRDMSGYIADLNKEVAFAMAENAENVERHAKKNHRFKTVNGKAESSVTTEYTSPKKNVHKMEIYLDDNQTEVITKKGKRSYVVFQHEGTYQSYEQSQIAPLYAHSVSKSGKGIKADPFLYRAIRQKWKMARDLKKITLKLQKKYEL